MVNEMTLSRISDFVSQLGALLSKVSGIGFWLFMLGIALLAVLLFAVVIKLLIHLVKILPNLTIGQFIKFVLVLAVILIVAGLFVP
ncbi:MAG: hypothetical protein QXP89_06970 [Desulfurococcaceae archaeon]